MNAANVSGPRASIAARIAAAPGAQGRPPAGGSGRYPADSFSQRGPAVSPGGGGGGCAPSSSSFPPPEVWRYPPNSSLIFDFKDGLNLYRYAVRELLQPHRRARVRAILAPQLAEQVRRA